MRSTLEFCGRVFYRFDSVEVITVSLNFFKQQNLLANGDIKNDFSECRKVD